MTKKPKLISSIRAKLISAVAMLLVAVIMVVSSTYAWFTLSTAPEVTGITTQIGANGALEMALLPADGNIAGITSQVGDSSIAMKDKNITWGNLVDLSDYAIYGLDKILLYPSALNMDAETGNILGAPVQIPMYGPDGRVDKLDTTKTMTSIYDAVNENFSAGKGGFGVRAIGAASGMTELQLAYRNSRSQAANATAAATTLAAQILNGNGSALANIAIEYAVDVSKASFDKDDVDALRALVDGLQGTTDAEGKVVTVGAITSIEKAYKLYIAAFATSKAAQTAKIDEKLALSIYNAAVNDNVSLANVVTMLGSHLETLAPNIKASIDKLAVTRTQVSAADSVLDGLEATLATNPEATFKWDDIKGAMTPLANPSNMVVNDKSVSGLKENLGDLVSSITSQGGLIVSMQSGAGVFADIADHCGDYSASVTIEEVVYGGITLKGMTARMNTKTSENPTFLAVTATAAETASSPAGSATDSALPFSEFYGYVIDMAFRTNAAESNLLLQTEATDRIYGDENNNEQTMGHGSTMTYTTLDPNFTPDQMATLMECLRIVFFTPDTKGANLGKVLVHAKLDMSKKTINGTEVSAPIMLYKVENGEEVFLDGSEGKAPVITALTQNTPTAVSVMVYLDGERLTNADVSATVAQSMTGSMNLQFASSAKLVPMENGNLHTPGAEVETTNP